MKTIFINKEAKRGQSNRRGIGKKGNQAISCIGTDSLYELIILSKLYP